MKAIAKPVLYFNAAPTAVWQLEIGELTGHNIEAKGREEVNRLLKEGWVMLHIYTLHYRENSGWHERPMAILGKPRVFAGTNATSSGCVPSHLVVPRAARGKPEARKVKRSKF